MSPDTMGPGGDRRTAPPSTQPSSSLPSSSLPKGGGAVRGIGEKFTVRPATGMGSMTVPVPVSPGRSGFGPQLELSYDSGSGNGIFGLGWTLSLPSVTRRTDRGLPQYDDASESDVFIMSAAEDLVPVTTGDAFADDTLTDPRYAIRRYRPRVDGLFARIERWTRLSDGDVHWRSLSASNVLTIYGLDLQSRISAPQDPDPAPGHPESRVRTFSWLISETRDDRGNAVVYRYKADDGDGDGFDPSRACERNRGTRTDPRRRTNRYLKRIQYGNRRPLLDAQGRRPAFRSDLPAGLDPDAHPDPGLDPVSGQGWMFEVVLDYGEHDTDTPTPQEVGTWTYRADPFSTYRPGFEVRTTRLCRRILMFHHIPDSPDTPGLPGAAVRAGYDGLVGATELEYRTAPYSCLRSVTRAGYRRDAAGPGYVRRSLPPLEFEYTEAVVQAQVLDVDADALRNLPACGIAATGPGHQWVDLHGDGVPGLLVEQAQAWYYTRNLSPLARGSGSGGGVAFGPTQLVALRPNQPITDGRAQFLDLAGGGHLDLVVLDGPVPGLYEHDEQEGWAPFVPFTSRLTRALSDSDVQLVDLTGDGHADVLLIEDEAFAWHPSLAEAGFGPQQRAVRPRDEEDGPQLVFADGTRSVHLADLSGDGLTDLVRIRNGEVCYWPNLGHGRFGSKITMDGLRPFDAPDQFDPRRLRLADIDGSGTTDLIYLHADGIRLYFNDCGNAWRPPVPLDVFPAVDNVVQIMVADLLGNGTACLVWASSLPADTDRPLRYVNLMGDDKPHLLVRTVNNLGAETLVRYAPSTTFSLRDSRDGHPWTTRLPFPVHVVERVETLDRVSRNRFVTRYAYHHGRYDRLEREFCGFGAVDQWDTEDIAVLSDGTPGDGQGFENENPLTHLPPVLTRTWFHTGGDVGHLPPGELALPPLPTGLSAAEEHEARRALKGSTLRQEVYALDHSDCQERPYLVRELTRTVRVEQPLGNREHAVLTSHPCESLESHFERNLDDPRRQHTLVLEVDAFGNALKSAAIGYGRTPGPAVATLAQAADQERQTTPLITFTDITVTDPITDVAAFPGDHRTSMTAQAHTFELTGYRPTGPGGLYRAEDFVAPDPIHPGRLRAVFEQEVSYEDTPSGPGRRRTIEWLRTLYRADDLTGLLPLGHLQPRALEGASYQLAFTAGLLDQVLRRGGIALLAGPDAPAEFLPAADTATVPELPAGSGGGRGGYVPGADLTAGGLFPETDPNGLWWLPAGRTFLSPPNPDGTPVSATAELAHAVRHFFLPHRMRDAFHTAQVPTETVVSYDAHDLLSIRSLDPVGNQVHVDVDYRVLQPYRITDPNGNVNQVALDALGSVAGTAVIGKPGQLTGDTLDGFDADPPQAQILAYLADPLADPDALLGAATTRFVYDLDAYRRSAGQPQLQPVAVAAIGRTTHVADLTAGGPAPVQQTFSYSDGFGRTVQEKVRADPPTVVDGFPVQPSRWVATGWTVFDNKGHPVRRCEPFFTSTTAFEFGVAVGVSPVLFYDPLGRVAVTLHPDDTYEKVTFDPWQQTTWDRNDTVLDDPRTDPDVAGYVAAFLAAHPGADGAPGRTWHQQRQDEPPGSPRQDADAKACTHARTPTTAHLDGLGRPFLTVTDNGPDPQHPGQHLLFDSRVELDIEGNPQVVRDCDHQGRDPLGRVIARSSYDLLGRRLRHQSMEAGTRWTLPDALGRPLRLWDERGRTVRTQYDPLRRPLRRLVAGADPVAPDRELVVDRLVYGEQHPQATERNLRGALHLHLDQAGALLIEARDVQSNVVLTGRRLTSGTAYRQDIDWRPVDDDHAALPTDVAVPFAPDALQAALSIHLEPDTYTVETAYDALNRHVTTTTPHTPAMRRSVIRPRWNSANLLDGVDVALRADPDDPLTWTPFVVNIDYDAKGRRLRVEHGNGAVTTFEYDPLTFRLARLLTSRADDRFQDLSYTYDPVGNLTHLRDDAQQQIFFDNQVVDPSSGYAYDATYRLVEATGREHLGQGATPLPHSSSDLLRSQLPHPGDGTAMGSYIERYAYDPVGNLLEMKHVGSHPAHPGWTRRYHFGETSAIEDGAAGAPMKTSNRLSDTVIGSGNDVPAERYRYDVHGNLLRLPSLGGTDPDQNLYWSLQDELRQVDLGGGGTAYYVYDAEGQRIRKVWEKTPQLIEERIYLGGFEIYRRRQGTQRLERETLHVMDGEKRVALIETRTLDTAGTDPAPPQLVRYQFGNHLTSTALELDDHARVISYEEYSPFGSTTYQAVAGQTGTPKRYRYTGKERDEETGFSYHGARYYAPWLGRWTAPDPAGVRTGPNLYVYVKNNPVGLLDPDGTEDKPPPAAKGADWWTTISLVVSVGFTLVTHQTPEHFGKGMVKKAMSVTVDPILTIYGPNGMLDKAAQKGVDRIMGIHKPDGAYVSEAEHKQQLEAIIAIGGALFPGLEGAVPAAKPGLQLAPAGAGAGAGGGAGVAAAAAPIAADAVDIVVTSASRPGALAAAGAYRAARGKPQWWLRNARAGDVTASTKGYQVYVLKDAEGRVLYVGKSGGAGGVNPQNWLDRVRKHILDPTKKEWIGEVDKITVTSDLTEMEAFAQEEVAIKESRATNKNISPGEFSTRFPQADLAANARSAATKPTYSFETDIVP